MQNLAYFSAITFFSMTSKHIGYLSTTRMHSMSKRFSSFFLGWGDLSYTPGSLTFGLYVTHFLHFITMVEPTFFFNFFFNIDLISLLVLYGSSLFFVFRKRISTWKEGRINKQTCVLTVSHTHVHIVLKLVDKKIDEREQISARMIIKRRWWEYSME